jgi:hypothetical protein
MKKVYLLYTCDIWHSNDSKSLLGVFTQVLSAETFALINAQEGEEGELTHEHCKQLCDKAQTNGREENYIIETEELNPLN